MALAPKAIWKNIPKPQQKKAVSIQQSENFCSTGRCCLFPPWGVFDAHKKELIFRAAA